jgi:hypothetical protein
LVDGQRITLEAGDIVLFPHGDAHILENGTAAKGVDMAKELARIFSSRALPQPVEVCSGESPRPENSKPTEYVDSKTVVNPSPCL